MFYSANIFRSAGIDKDQVYLPTIGVGAINVLMTVVSVYLVGLAPNFADFIFPQCRLIAWGAVLCTLAAWLAC